MVLNPAATPEKEISKNYKNMKKSVIIALVTCSLTVLSGATGRAGTFWDIDLCFEYLSGTAEYKGFFDIKGKYNPALETVTNAQAWFLVSDDLFDWQKERVALDLGNKPFIGPSNASANLLGGQISGDALKTLATTYTLQYTFRAIEGDFLALAAKLYVETCPKTVPDGGATLMLLGLSLAGIEPLRRRMARRNTQPKRA